MFQLWVLAEMSLWWSQLTYGYRSFFEVLNPDIHNLVGSVISESLHVNQFLGCFISWDYPR